MGRCGIGSGSSTEPGMGTHCLHYLEPIVTWITQDAKPPMVEVVLMVMFRMEQWPCCILCCTLRLPISWSCITESKSHFNYLTYNTKNCWRPMDTHGIVLSIQNVPPSRIAFRMIWTYSLPFRLVGTRPFGKAEPSNIVAQVALILLKVIYLAKWFILPIIHLFINQYPHAIAHNRPIIVLLTKCSITQNQEPRENMLMDSVLLCLVSLVPPGFYCICNHDRLWSLFLWPPCWMHQSRNMCSGIQMPLLCTFRILEAIVWIHIRFNIWHPVVFTFIWISQVIIPVMPIFIVQHAYRCTWVHMWDAN